MKNHSKLFSFSLILIAIIGFMPLIAHADEAMSNQYLQRALNELNAAKLFVQQAKAQQSTKQRVVFHYNWILSDINKIEAGIQQKFNKPRIQPRVIKPMKGDYLTVVGESK